MARTHLAPPIPQAPHGSKGDSASAGTSPTEGDADAADDDSLVFFLVAALLLWLAQLLWGLWNRLVPVQAIRAVAESRRFGGALTAAMPASILVRAGGPWRRRLRLASWCF